MSWQAMDAVDRIPHHEIDALRYRVLVKLANVAAEDGTRAWRNIHQVAAELRVSERSVRRAIKDLENDRLIIRGDQHHVDHLRADRRPVVYDLNMPKMLDWDAYHGTEQTPLDGVTELLTPPVDNSHGVTHGVTTGVHHKELIELPTKTKRVSYGSARERARVTITGPCGHTMVTDRHCEMGCKPAPELVLA